MQIKDIAPKIIEMEKVPIYFNDSKAFSAVTYLKPNSDLQRGLYLPDCDSSEALEYCRLNTPDGFRRIEKMICTKCDFDEISFSVFSILHEWGHWIQYNDFIEEGHTDQEFVICYEWQRAIMHMQRENEYKKCRSKEDAINFNEKYENLYAELPTEKYANEFALRYLWENVMKIKEPFKRQEQTLKLREELLDIEEKRLVGENECSLDELDTYLENII